jgi:hypothetical protein
MTRLPIVVLPVELTVRSHRGAGDVRVRALRTTSLAFRLITLRTLNTVPLTLDALPHAAGSAFTMLAICALAACPCHV